MGIKYDLVIFDLDGTLLDTSKGIFNSVRYAEQTMGLSPVSDDKLSLFVGPPPKDMYQKLYGLSIENAIQATQYHRAYAKERGMYEFVAYNGIEDVLKMIKMRGVKLAIATLKAEKIARDILEYAKLIKYFDAVVGMDEKETRTKEDTICIAKNLTKSSNVLMVGDSKYDEIGARQAVVDFMAVTYGFGFQRGETIDGKGVVGVADTPDQIFKLLTADDSAE